MPDLRRGVYQTDSDADLVTPSCDGVILDGHGRYKVTFVLMLRDSVPVSGSANPSFEVRFVHAQEGRT